MLVVVYKVRNATSATERSGSGGSSNRRHVIVSRNLLRRNAVDGVTATRRRKGLCSAAAKYAALSAA